MITLLRQAARFGAVGVAATLVHVCLARAAAIEISPLAANNFGFAGAFGISYLGNFYWTFARRAGHALHLPKFVVLSAGSLALTNLIVLVVVRDLALPFEVALAAIVLCVPAMNFLLARFWVYRSAASHPEPAAPAMR